MRYFKKSMCALVAFCATLGVAEAQDWEPRRVVNVIVHTGPGAGADAFARAVINVIEQEKLSNARFVVVNKTGGGSTNAINYLASKDGDDNTLGVYASNWTTDYLVQKEATTSLQSLTPIANMIFEPALIMVRADSKFKSLKEFIDAAKAEPNIYKQAGGSPLGRDAMLHHILVANTGAKWPLVSFPSGGERLSAILGGHVDTLVMDGSEVGDFLTSGKLRALAQVSDEKIPTFPADVPTIREAGYDVPTPLQPRGIVAPPNMSAEASEYYRRLFAKVVETPAWKKYVEDTRVQTSLIVGDDLSGFFAKVADTTRAALASANIAVAR